jgi:hypothetical protein
VIKHFKAFLLGIVEFRSDFTTHIENYDLLRSYDLGREWAHKLTFRVYD